MRGRDALGHERAGLDVHECHVLGNAGNYVMSMEKMLWDMRERYMVHVGGL